MTMKSTNLPTIFIALALMPFSALAAKVGCPSMTGEQVRLTTCENKTMTLSDNFTYTIAPEYVTVFSHCSDLRGRRFDKIRGSLRDMRTSKDCTYKLPKKWRRHANNIKLFSIHRKTPVVTCPKLNFAVVYTMMERADKDNVLDSSGDSWRLDKNSEQQFREALIKFKSTHGKYAPKIARRLRYRLSTLSGTPKITYKSCEYSLKSWEVILNGVPKSVAVQRDRKDHVSTKDDTARGA